MKSIGPLGLRKTKGIQGKIPLLGIMKKEKNYKDAVSKVRWSSMRFWSLRTNGLIHIWSGCLHHFFLSCFGLCSYILCLETVTYYIECLDIQWMVNHYFLGLVNAKRFHLFILFIDTKTFHLFSIVLKSFFVLEAYGIGKCICMVIKIFCCKLYCSFDIIRYILLVCILSWMHLLVHLWYNMYALRWLFEWFFWCQFWDCLPIKIISLIALHVVGMGDRRKDRWGMVLYIMRGIL